MKKAVFLDRDGVINQAFLIDGFPRPPRDVSEVRILDGVIQSIAYLERAEFEVVVVTNQPDVARGLMTRESVEEIHNYLGERLGIKDFYTCFHDDIDQCECRKPKSGLLQRAAAEKGISLTKSFMVGDRWRDIAAGQSAGCRCYFVDYSYREQRPVPPFVRVLSLLDATLEITGVRNESKS